MIKKDFRIATLSSYNSLRDPVTIITGGLGLIQTLFPNIFGGGRRVLTNEDWIKLIPGNGYITTALRTWLKNRIHYDSDLKDMEMHTIGFAQTNSMSWCPDGSCQGNPESVLMPKFYALLRKEQSSGGSTPFGQTPPFISGISGIDTTTALLIGGGLLALILIGRNKKRK